MSRENADELDLYAWNTGELYPSRRRIIGEMLLSITDGTYDKRKAEKAWFGWYTEAARRYKREIDSSTHFPRSEIVKAAKERAKDEYDKIKRGEYD